MRSNRSLPALSAGFMIGFAISTAGAQNTIVLTVPDQYPTISAAVAEADGDTNSNDYYDIQVTPGTYVNDFPRVTRPMTIETANSGEAVVMKATEALPNEKGIILTLSSLTVNGLTFTGAEIENSLGGNGAGIRDLNTGPATVLVENSTFTNNQEGMLTGYDANETVTVINSKFINNGNPSQTYFQHALYVNYAGTLTVSNSLFCGQLIGHDVKSRAAVTIVENSQLYDGAGNAALGCNAGSTSLAIDATNGGAVTISGNQIIQGPDTQNIRMVDYGEAGLIYSNNNFLVSNNSFTNTAPGAIAIYDPNCVAAQLSNNTFTGITTIVDPASCAVYTTGN
jgi:hypothetical protein